MKVILLQDVAKIGKRHEVKEVSDGHGLHFLIPKGLAETATPEALAELAQRKEKMAEGEQARHAVIQNTINTLDGTTFNLTLKANEQGHLFAAIHAEEIASAILKDMNCEIAPECIHLDESIKEVGEYEVALMANDSKGKLRVHITAE